MPFGLDINRFDLLENQVSVVDPNAPQLALTQSAFTTAQVVQGQTPATSGGLLPVTGISTTTNGELLTIPTSEVVSPLVLPPTIPVSIGVAFDDRLAAVSTSTGINPAIILGGAAVLGLVILSRFK